VWSSRVTGNSSIGISLQGGGKLEVLRCQVLANSGGGIQVQNGSVTITSTIIANNGANGSPFGGVQLMGLNGIAPALQFDTIANNTMKNQNGAAPGLQADNSAAVAIASSILFGNTQNSAPFPPQICTNCGATYSLFSSTAAIGTGNITGAPGFVNAAALDYHIDASSSARGTADQNATVHFDVDNETRPQGAYDMGADEIP
jgi:hypothetical protein